MGNPMDAPMDDPWLATSSRLGDRRSATDYVMGRLDRAIGGNAMEMALARSSRAMTDNRTRRMISGEPRHSIAIPPLTCSVAPVTQAAASDAR